MDGPLDQITGRPARSAAILAVVSEAIAEGNCTFENVSAKIAATTNASFGELGTDEFAAAVEILRPAEFSAEPKITPPVLVNGRMADPETEALHAAEQAANAEQVAQADMSRDEAQARLKALQNALHLARQDRMKADAEVQTARGTMAAAILEWNGSGPSPDAIRRNELDAINRDRSARTGPTRYNNQRALRSRIDQEAYYGTGGDANSMVRGRHRYGSFHRAAIGDDGVMHRPGRRGATVPKLPSER